MQNGNARQVNKAKNCCYFTIYSVARCWNMNSFYTTFFSLFSPSCCFLSCGRCFVVVVLFYPLADWYRLYVFPPEPRKPTHNHLLISTPVLFIPSSHNAYILRKCSSVSVSHFHTSSSRLHENNLQRLSSTPRVTRPDPPPQHWTYVWLALRLRQEALHNSVL